MIILQFNIEKKTRDAAALDRLGVTSRHPALDHTLMLQNLAKVMYLFAGRRRQSDVASLQQANDEGRIRLTLKEYAFATCCDCVFVSK